MHGYVKGIEWQTTPDGSWAWPSYRDTYVDGYEHVGIDNIWIRWAFIGPLQLRWYITKKNK